MEPVQGQGPINFLNQLLQKSDAPAGPLKMILIGKNWQRSSEVLSSAGNPSEQNENSSVQESATKVPQVSHVVSLPKNESQQKKRKITVSERRVSERVSKALQKETQPLKLTKTIAKEACLPQEIENFRVTILEKLIIEQSKKSSFLDFLGKISDKEDRNLFIECVQNMAGEDVINFFDIADIFFEKNKQTKILKFLTRVHADKRFAAGMLIKKNFEYNGNPKDLGILFRISKVDNKNIMNIIENAEKLFREKTSIPEKIIIIKKFAEMSGPDAREVFANLTKKLLSNEKTAENDLKVINCLEKINEDEITSVVELAYQFFDEGIGIQLKLVIIENILTIKAADRKSICQFVKKIFPKEATLGEIVTCIKCFEEINWKLRSFFCEQIKKRFEGKMISSEDKLQFMEWIRAEQLVENLLSV